MINMTQNDLRVAHFFVISKYLPSLDYDISAKVPYTVNKVTHLDF